MSDDESSQEGGGAVDDGMLGILDDGGGSGVLAVADGAAGTGGGVSMQMLKAAAARKRVKSSKPKRSSSSSSRTRPVVKLLVTSVSRSYSEPWRRRQQRESSGTGFLIRWHDDDNAADNNNTVKANAINRIRIVTNAHVVRNASTVRARASFGPHVVSCEVEWLSLPLDLALLKIAEGDWDDFCKGWKFGDLPSVDDLVKRERKNSELVATTMDAPLAVVVQGDGDATTDDGNGKDNATTSKKKSNSADSICLTLSSGLPKLDENVTCVGFPQGGTQISVTRGVVSRIDVDAHYVLRIQIDAAINPGNSGGPVFDEKGQVVGVASSHLRAASNIGYIIPSKIVSMFLQMCMDGMEVKVEDRFSGLGELVVRTQEELDDEPKHVPGIPNLRIHGSQSLESKALRRHLGLEELEVTGGVRIVGAVGSGMGEESKDAPAGSDGKEENDSGGNNGDSANGETDHDGDHLRGNDVLLAINSIPIGMDGTIQLSPDRPDERINFRSLVTCQRVGSKVSLDVLRNKQRRELEVVLDMSKFLVSQYDDFDAIPLYVVVGGCVFSPLSLPLVQEKKSKSPSSFSRYYRDQRNKHEQVLVLSKVLNDDVNVGYHGWKNLVLKSVNGYEPSNIQELVAVLVRKMHSEMIEFRCQLVGQDDADYVIVMSLKEVLQSEHRVLKQHMIASWCSTDATSKELREEVEQYEPSEAKRTVSWNTMKDVRSILERKEEN
mmetsp:Transcript_13965/g.24910  ORF Transcript_13965/g.24910 Transcript_13965/m.24910 type:complete len:721 (-) Transcript_13965:174-2336(-)